MRDQEEKAIYLMPVLKDAMSSKNKAEKERKKEINMKFLQECSEHGGCLCLAAPGRCSPGSDCVDMFLTCPGQQINGINEVSISIGDWGGG